MKHNFTSFTYSVTIPKTNVKNSIDIYYVAHQSVQGLQVKYYIPVIIDSKTISYYHYLMPPVKKGYAMVYPVNTCDEAKSKTLEVIVSTGAHLITNINYGNPDTPLYNINK